MLVIEKSKIGSQWTTTDVDTSEMSKAMARVVVTTL